jgi:spore maturation protein SpmA
MKIAEKGGLIRILAYLLNPLLKWLFPSIPPGIRPWGPLS